MNDATPAHAQRLSRMGASWEVRTLKHLHAVTIVLLLSAIGILTVSQPQIPKPLALGYPHFDIVVNILDFRDSDHTANMSIIFQADFEMKNEEPVPYGMEFENTWDKVMPDYVQHDINGTSVDSRIGRWETEFSVRAHAFGASELYPYDSWMFNLTLSTPLLHYANETNFYGNVQPSARPGWDIQTVSFGNAGPFRLTHTNYDDSATVTIVLKRADWQTMPVRLIPMILLLILGVTVLIPPEDLSSKATVCTSVMFFVAALLFNLKDLISPLRFGLSYVEALLYYLILSASFFLLLAIGENLTTKEGSILYRRSKRGKEVVQLIMRLTTMAVVLTSLSVFVTSYEMTASRYSWIYLPVVETRLAPVLAATSGIFLTMVVLPYKWKKREKK
jgi:hypothetical protein